jgi:small-conductance mechanosensitive channel
LGIRSSDDGQFLCATSFFGSGHHRLSPVLRAQYCCQPSDISHYSQNRPNLGVVFARLTGAATILLGFLVAFSVVSPSFQVGDLIKILGIIGVAIGFAFQNILQNFLAGLLLLWAEPFRVGDEIRLDNYEGTVEEIQARATIIETYDGRRVVIPNADLFTHSVTVNTALDIRRWEYDLTLKDSRDLAELKSFIIKTVSKVGGFVGSQP